jgi:hypothetical protein
MGRTVYTKLTDVNDNVIPTGLVGSHPAIPITDIPFGKFDTVTLTYVAAGNGVGEIETVTYSKDAADLFRLTLTYDGSNNLSTVVRSEL